MARRGKVIKRKLVGLTLLAILIVSAVAFFMSDSGRSAYNSVFSDNPSPATNIEELKQYALKLINEDREKHGVAPVVMGTNSAAQTHAEDGLKYEYGGHWYKNGEKPYMVYSRTGGDSYVNENSHQFGWTSEMRKEYECGSYVDSNCLISSPRRAIQNFQFEFVYNDAHVDWLHRENIINPKHLKVNIGIGFYEVAPWFITFYQHFEGGHFIATEPISLHGTELTIKVKNVTQEYDFCTDCMIQVVYDPPPTEMTVDEIMIHYNYWIGGGDVPNLSLKETLAALVLGPGSVTDWTHGELDLEPQGVIASKWVETHDYLEVIADLQHRIYDSGVYTVLVFGTHKETGEHVDLISLSVVKP